MDKEKLTLVILSAMALSMSVAGIFMSIFVKDALPTIILLLSIGMFCLAIAVLSKVVENE